MKLGLLLEIPFQALFTQWLIGLFFIEKSGLSHPRMIKKFNPNLQSNLFPNIFPSCYPFIPTAQWSGHSPKTSETQVQFTSLETVLTIMRKSYYGKDYSWSLLQCFSSYCILIALTQIQDEVSPRHNLTWGGGGKTHPGAGSVCSCSSQTLSPSGHCGPCYAPGARVPRAERKKVLSRVCTMPEGKAGGGMWRKLQQQGSYYSSGSSANQGLGLKLLLLPDWGLTWNHHARDIEGILRVCQK